PPSLHDALPISNVQFQWTGGSGVATYWLSVGTTQGGGTIYDADQGLALSRTVSNLPTDGSTVYVRLLSYISGGWQFNDYTYQASSPTPAKAELTTPPPGSTLSASTVQFQWTGGSGVSDAWLSIGTTPGGGTIYDADQGVSLSHTVSNLPTDGSTFY